MAATPPRHSDLTVNRSSTNHSRTSGAGHRETAGPSATANPDVAAGPPPARRQFPQPSTLAATTNGQEVGADPNAPSAAYTRVPGTIPTAVAAKIGLEPDLGDAAAVVDDSERHDWHQPGDQHRDAAATGGQLSETVLPWATRCRTASRPRNRPTQNAAAAPASAATHTRALPNPNPTPAQHRPGAIACSLPRCRAGLPRLRRPP